MMKLSLLSLVISIGANVSVAWVLKVSPLRPRIDGVRPVSTTLWANEGSNSLSWFSTDSNNAPSSLSRNTDDDDIDEQDLGNIQIPSTGISVMDDLEASQKERFTTELVPITGLTEVAAQIVTYTSSGSLEVVRYIVALSQPSSSESFDQESEQSQGNEERRFVMVDIPPFSAQLAAAIRAYMGPDATLVTALITSRDAIHYDDTPAVFTTRRSDLLKWSDAFPGLHFVGYRLDVPRDCRESVTHLLDGYGPFALQEDFESKNVTFVETGRPLTVLEWDYDVALGVLNNGNAPPDEDEAAGGDDEEYSPAAIRAREEGKRLLAIYTPGHSFGSVSYVFPETKICCSGFSLPIEDTREDDDDDDDDDDDGDFGLLQGTGPSLDYRGYITTSRAGFSRQMESARKLVNQYTDRFNVVFPSRGDPVYLDGDTEERKKNIFGVLDQFEKIGKIYEQLGITSSENDDTL